MAPLTSCSTLDLWHAIFSCCILHWGFLAFCVICQQQKNGVNTTLCWSYVQRWKCIQHVWKLYLNVFWQEGSRPVYFGYMLAFLVLLNVTIFFYVSDIGHTVHTHQALIFVHCISFFTLLCLNQTVSWLQTREIRDSLESDTITSVKLSLAKQLKNIHLSIKHFVFVAN